MKVKHTFAPALSDITSEQKILEPEKDGLTGIPAVSIAKSLGHASSQHLATQFRKIYGVTASEWRISAKRPSRHH